MARVSYLDIGVTKHYIDTAAERRDVCHTIDWRSSQLYIPGSRDVRGKYSDTVVHKRECKVLQLFNVLQEHIRRNRGAGGHLFRR